MKALKRLTLIAIIAIVGTMPAMAQISVGPKVGLALNDLSYNLDIFSSNNRIGFTGGITAEFMLPVVNLGFDVSAMYVHRSSDITDGWSSEEMIMERDYIEVPINLKWKIAFPAIGNVFAPYIFTGPSFSFLVSDKHFNDFISSKSCDIAWNVGAGIQLFKKIQIGVSCGFGLTEAIAHTQPGSNNYVIEGKNNHWTLTTAFLF